MKEVDLKLPVTIDSKRYQESNWQAGVYENALWFDFSIDTSNLKKSTRAVKGVIIFSDLFGEAKLKIGYTYDDPIAAGTQSVQVNGVGFDYNQYRNPHVWVRNTEIKDMVVHFQVSQIIYQ